jgi:hypothetical protein
MRLRLSTSSLVVVAMLLCASVASAGEQQADLSTYVGWGDNLGDSSANERTFGTYIYTGFAGSAAFERRGPRSTVTARVGGAVRYFPDLQEFFTLDRSASLGVDAQIASNSRLWLTQTVQYSPYRQFGSSIFPTEEAGALPTYDPEGAATVGHAFYDLATAVELSRKFNQRTELAVDYGFRVSLAEAAMDVPISQRAGIGVRHSLGRYTALKFGTAYRFIRTGYQLRALPTKALDFDIGVDYSRPLTFSRGTSLEFSTGTALVSRAATVLEPGELGHQLIAIGSVTLSQTLGRSWEAQLGADRNLQYVDGFPDPFYASRIMSRLTGDIGRRFNLVATAEYSVGSGVGSSVSQNYNGFQGQSQLAYELTRRWRLFGAFYYTDNRLSADSLSTLPAGTILRPNQASVQFGLNFHID